MKIFIINILVQLSILSFIYSIRDPFAALGIPTLNPSEILQEKIPFENYSNQFEIKGNTLKSIEDLPKILQKSSLTEEEGTRIISNFLIADDYFMKKNGVVFDQSGFDGILNMESPAPKSSKLRLSQRARSAAKIYYDKNYENSSYEPYGAEEIQIKGEIKNWKKFKILLINQNNANDHLFVNVCISVDEMLPPIVTNFNLDCADKTKMIEEAKIRNEPYLDKIKKNNFFIKKNKEKIADKNNIINNNSVNNSIPTPPTDSFLNKSSSFKFSQFSGLNIKNVKQNINGSNDIEIKVEKLNEKINNLENRMVKEEDLTKVNTNDLKNLKQNLDTNFNKLNTVLEKLENKL